MEQHNKIPKKGKLPIVNVLMPLLFIVAIACAVVAWHRLAGAPFWLAAVLGLPTGFITVFGGLWLLARAK
jgi:hypothetical protein